MFTNFILYTFTFIGIVFENIFLKKRRFENIVRHCYKIILRFKRKNSLFNLFNLRLDHRNWDLFIFELPIESICIWLHLIQKLTFIGVAYLLRHPHRKKTPSFSSFYSEKNSYM